MALLSRLTKTRPANGPSRGARWMWVVGGLLLCAGPDLAAQSLRFDEYQVKAAFLFNFAQFVDWPRAAFREPESPFVIGVLGDNPFGEALDETVRGERIGGRPMEVRRYRSPSEIEDCHVLFISRSEAARVKDILGSFKGRALLTVSDLDNFARLGGMIGMGTDRNRIRLFVNVEAATAANLTISSKLLRAATIIGPSGPTRRGDGMVRMPVWALVPMGAVPAGVVLRSADP